MRRAHHNPTHPGRVEIVHWSARRWRSFAHPTSLTVAVTFGYNLYHSGGKSAFFKPKMGEQVRALKHSTESIPIPNIEDAPDNDALPGKLMNND
jgi:hypothetical protein